MKKRARLLDRCRCKVVTLPRVLLFRGVRSNHQVMRLEVDFAVSSRKLVQVMGVFGNIDGQTMRR